MQAFFLFLGSILFYWYGIFRWTTKPQAWTYEPYHIVCAVLTFVSVLYIIFSNGYNKSFIHLYDLYFLPICSWILYRNIYYTVKNIYEYNNIAEFHNINQIIYIGLDCVAVVFFLLWILKVIQNYLFLTGYAFI